MDFRAKNAMAYRTAYRGEHTCNLLSMLDLLPLYFLLDSSWERPQQFVVSQLGLARYSCLTTFRHRAIRNHIVELDRATTSTAVYIQAQSPSVAFQKAQLVSKRLYGEY